MLREVRVTWFWRNREMLYGQRDWEGFLEEVGIDLRLSRGAVPGKRNSLSKDWEAKDKQVCAGRERETGT